MTPDDADPTTSVSDPTTSVSDPTTSVSDLRSDAAPPSGTGSDDRAFVVKLESLCREPWKGLLVPHGGADAKPAPFEIRSSKTHELRLLPGDAILLTTPHGGIMDVRFDGTADGYDARVEVNAECSGVKRTLVREATR